MNNHNERNNLFKLDNLVDYIAENHKTSCGYIVDIEDFFVKIQTYDLTRNERVPKNNVLKLIGTRQSKINEFRSKYLNENKK